MNMGNAYFCFNSTLNAKGDSRLNNATIRDLWKGFCHLSGELVPEDGAANTFATAGMEIPALPEGKEYVIDVTDKGFAVAGRDYGCLARGVMVLMMRIEAADLTRGAEKFYIRPCHIESEYTIANRMIHFCVFPETTPLFLKKGDPAGRCHAVHPCGAGILGHAEI